jgi:radical SAM protein with 4Fe4S-binding SPASM domain
MISKAKNKIIRFIQKNPQISPSLTRFPIPDTFWKAGIFRLLFRLSNYYFAYSRMLSKKDRVRGYPSHLFIDVTNICNLKCPLCPTGAAAPGRPEGMMPLAMFKRVIDEMGEYLISVDLFNWGEPLLNKNIYEMVAYAHKHHIITSISTNFNYLPGNSAERLITSGLDILILSIDGASHEVYEKYRVGGKFSKVIDNISAIVNKRRQLGATNPYICWQFLVMRHNEHEIEASKEMASKLGIDKITIDHAYLPVATREEAMKWLPKNPKYHRYNLEELEKGWNERKVHGEQSESTHNHTIESSVMKDCKRRVDCSWLWTQATINCDGSLSPCCAIFDPAADFGDLSHDSFRNIWNNEKYMVSRHFSSTGEMKDPVTICMKCPLA